MNINYYVLVAAACTALRRGDVATLEWKDVDIKDRLESRGYRVEIMPYTTRVYGQVLQVYKGKSEPYFTICRLPLSVRSNDSSGILKAGSCHIKLHNHLCYVENVGAVAMQCCKDAGVTIQNISRIDLCADFQYFYNGMHPSTLIKGFASEKYLKIGQPRFTLHGTTEKGYNYYNSVLFGSKTSSVYTRFYEKSLEMKEVGSLISLYSPSISVKNTSLSAPIALAMAQAASSALILYV